MITPLAEVQDLADRLGEQIVDTFDVAVAKSFLRLVSAQVRHYGADWEDPLLAPEIAIAIVIEAAARGYLNPEGFKLERGDEITFEREGVFAAGSALTIEEIRSLRLAGGRSGWYSVLTARDVTVTDTQPDASAVTNV